MMFKNSSKDNMNLRRIVILGAMQCLAGEGPSQRQKANAKKRKSKAKGQGTVLQGKVKGKGKGKGKSKAKGQCNVLQEQGKEKGKGKSKGKSIGGKVLAKPNTRHLEHSKIWHQVFLQCSKQGWSIGDAKAEASKSARAHVQWMFG